jgi:hypothetical protein
MVNCAGCSRTFSHSGYTYHVQHTRNARCVAEYRAQVNGADNHDASFDPNGDSSYINNDEWDNDEYMDDDEHIAEDFEWPSESEISRYSIKTMYYRN